MKANHFLWIYVLIAIAAVIPTLQAAIVNENNSSSELRVKSIFFHGNTLILDDELLQALRTQVNAIYNPQSAVDDSEIIAEIYNSKGFNNVIVLYPEAIPLSPEEVNVHFHIREKKQYKIKDIVLTGNSYISTERINRETGYRRGELLSLEVIDTFMMAVVNVYASRGFLFADAKLDSLVSNNDFSGNYSDGDNELKEAVNNVALTAHISIDEGRFCRFENFIITGNEVTTENSLMRISGLDRMELFSLENLRIAEENVRRKEYIADFLITPINHQTLLLSLEEDRMTHINGMLGYDSTKEDVADRITGFINLKMLNLYGTDRSLAFLWQRLQPHRQYVEFKYYESGPFNYPLAGEISLNRETVDSTYIMNVVEGEAYYYTLRNKYGIYAGSDDIIPGSRRPIIVPKRSYKKLGLIWRYNSENYYLNPTTGTDLSVRHYYIIHREQNVWVNKQATEITWKHYIPLMNPTAIRPPLVMMFSLNGSQIQNKFLQEYEYYYLGGIHNIRGFRERQFAGHRVLWSNLELRYLFTRKSRLFAFIDYGYVEIPQQERAINDLIGIGFGVRLDTRIGLIGVDYGFSRSDNQWMHPLDGMVHFGIETKF